jgi:hypothetical protein
MAHSRIRLRLAPDYGAFPIWPESEAARPLRIPDDLPLSPGLVSDLWQWAAVHDSARTAASDFEWNEAVAGKRDWIEHGRYLSYLVQLELGDNFDLVYELG